MNKIRYITPIVFLIISFTVPAAAQAPSSESDNSSRRSQGQRGMMMGDPEQMQKMMSDRFKDLLGISDEEWTVIGPKVVKVLTLSFQSRGNPGMMLMGRPGAQGFGSQGSAKQGRPNMRIRMPANFRQNEADESIQELQKLLEDDNADPNRIKQQVTKVRKAKEKSQQELATAQKELRELLTVRQEAMLIAMGLLD